MQSLERFSGPPFGKPPSLHPKSPSLGRMRTGAELVGHDPGHAPVPSNLCIYGTNSQRAIDASCLTVRETAAPACQASFIIVERTPDTLTWQGGFRGLETLQFHLHCRVHSIHKMMHVSNKTLSFSWSRGDSPAIAAPIVSTFCMSFENDWVIKGIRHDDPLCLMRNRGS